jgi:glycosyltransferase involved in cell wall biosynthesis
LRAEKNLVRLLRAFRLAVADGPDGPPPGRLMIIGDGPERPMLEAMAQQPGLLGRVHFTGHQADPAAGLAEFDIFALSSDTEQMPISLLEAMAASLPVAATDVGDVRMMLPAESQNSITALDDAALGTAMRRLLLDPAARQCQGAANRRRVVQTYSETAMFAAYADLFDQSAAGA